MRRGFTLVEIMIVVAIIALLAAIAIPNLLRARLTANEAAAQASLRTISTAMESLRSTTGSYESVAGTDATLGFLGNPGVGVPPYIDTVLGCATPPCAKQGYNFAQIIVEADNQTYVVAGQPLTANVTGIRSFCVTEDGVVRVQAAGGAIASRAACQALPISQ